MYKTYLLTLALLSLIVSCKVTNEINIKPMAHDDHAIITQNIENTIDILKNDQPNGIPIDKSSIIITLKPKYGDIKIDTESGTILYTLNDINQTQDIFKYQVKNINGLLSNEAIVTLEIKKTMTKAKNWYIKIVAINQSDNITISDTKFGELETKNTDIYNLKTYNKFDTTNFNISLISNQQKFKSLFYTHNDQTKKWSFKLNSDNKNADILLTWQGIYVLEKFTDKYNRTRYKEYRYTKNPIVNYLKLIDKQNGVEIPAIQNSKICKYQFNMNGKKSREFEWVLNDIPINSKTFKQTPTHKQVIQKTKINSFDLHTPPAIDRDTYGTNDK